MLEPVPPKSLWYSSLKRCWPCLVQLVLKYFVYFFIKMNCVCKFTTLRCEFDGFSFLVGMGCAQNWGKIKMVSLINV
jgi:hypothetical protein